MFRDENCDIILKTANFHYEICAAGKNIVKGVLSSSYNSFVRNVVTFRLLDSRLLLAIIVV